MEPPDQTGSPSPPFLPRWPFFPSAKRCLLLDYHTRTKQNNNKTNKKPTKQTNNNNNNNKSEDELLANKIQTHKTWRVKKNAVINNTNNKPYCFCGR